MIGGIERPAGCIWRATERHHTRYTGADRNKTFVSQRVCRQLRCCNTSSKRSSDSKSEVWLAGPYRIYLFRGSCLHAKMQCSQNMIPMKTQLCSL